MSDTKFERNAGILMPVSSLPSPYGIGTFGKDAYDFVTFVKECNHKYWQVLPLGPTTMVTAHISHILRLQVIRTLLILICLLRLDSC